jgi:hypothetical protein
VIIEKLKSSPLFYLFLSSRELFHSNFWFWLSTLNKAETIKLFTNKNIGGNLTYKREHNQSNGEFKSTVDLYISSDNSQKVAIENKVKDFPTLEQLERIKNSFGTINIELVLTTLFWTPDLTFNNWTVKTYRTISEAIIPGNYSDNKYYQDLITDYKQFTLNLTSLAEQLEIKQEYDFAISKNKELYSKLNDIRLWEGYQKLRASHLQFHFKNSNAHNVTTSYGINNQKATIDFVLDLKDGYKLGVQIEDIQYRKFVIGRKAGKFAENLIDNNLFLNNKFSGRGKKSYLNYGNTFKYQYEKIEKINFTNLFDRINEDFKNIKTDIDRIEEQIPGS